MEYICYLCRAEYVDVCKFLSKMPKLKFDVIIGNPPFQPPTNSKAEDKANRGGAAIWNKFVVAMCGSLKESGYLAFINPPNWRVPTGAQERDPFQDVRDVLSKFDLKFLMTSVEKYFGLMNSMDAYVVQKSPEKGITKLRFCKYGGHEAEIDQSNFHMGIKHLPIKADALTLSILSKILSFPAEKLTIINTSARFLKGKVNPRIVDDETPEHKYPLLMNLFKCGFDLSKAKINWSSEVHPHQFRTKILIPKNGRYFTFPLEEGKYGLGLGVSYIPVDSREEGLALGSFLNSQLIKFYTSRHQDPDTMTFPLAQMRDLPRLPNKMWSDGELYGLFGLSKDEIDRVESIKFNASGSLENRHA